MLNQEIGRTYDNVRKINKRYGLGNVLKKVGKAAGIITLSAPFIFNPVTADAQTRQRVAKRQLTPRTVRYHPNIKARTTVRNPRVPIRARTTGRFIPRMARVPSGINFVFSRGYYGYLQRGLFYPFGFGPNSYAFAAGQMFCQYPLMRWNGPWAIPVEQAEQSQEIQEYQARISELEQENRELRKRASQVIERTREVVKEVPVIKEVGKYPEYRFGYENRDMYPSQWVSETASYFNWYFNMNGSNLHAYSNAAVYVDGKKYEFDIAVRDENGNTLYVFEFRGNQNQKEKEKINLIETGRVENAYIITPTSDKGPDLEKQLRPYKDMMLHTNS